ncbi:MAG: hypothetical protein B7Z12_11430 [Caulobacter vibrioides]|uniref:Peptidase S9 prolyl oligopeptidase catalytic domain-containing protein n=1 Tax=Caulobacter vibrioides TaxID=155892 RepID=A0A258D4C0_CAUVI|nr:MAG: hypothetical protein B7Z12_11430 [Caulobacter vibrioides]
MRLFAGLALACALTASAQAAPRPFTLDDQLSLQDFGRVAFSPDGRWLIAEQYGRYADAPNFDHEFLDHQSASRLYLADLRAGGTPRAFLTQEAKAGDTFGAFSPDGTKVLVFRLKDHRREMGVASLATGAVTWSGLTADPEVWAAQARWRDDHQVVVITRAPDAPSILLGTGWQTQARTQEAWAANGRGDYSGVTLGSGRYAGLNPGPADYGLAVFDDRTGQSRVLARGGFVDMLLSPDGRSVALAQEAELTAAADGGVIRLSSPPRRRRLVVVDLETGKTVRPCPRCDLAPNSWAWSPDSQGVVAAARDEPAFDAPYRYWRLDATGAAAVLAAELRVALVPGGNTWTPTGQVAWLGPDPVVLARSEGDARSDWWRLTAKGAVKLTARFAAPLGRASAADAEGLLISTSSGLVRLPPRGEPRVLAPPAIPWQSLRILPGQPVNLLLANDRGRGRLVGTNGAEGRAAAPPEDADVRAVSANGDVAAIVRDRQGVRTLMLYRSPGRRQPLLTINNPLADVQFSRPVPKPGLGLADAILRIVDAAHAQHPGVSDRRVALWGQSFGGWSTLMAGAQSPRFKALVATAPVSDLVTFHSSLRPISLAVPEVGMSLTNMQGWAEGGQGRMGGPPWTALDRYVRNSPLLNADKITAPVLIAYGDMDFDSTQVTAMFLSLARQGKDAQLLYYRGENHMVLNPANIRDLHQRAFAFLADALGPVSPPDLAVAGSSAPAAILSSQ